jgi:hypothetical protein
VESNAPISGEDVASLPQVAGAPAPAAPGTKQSVSLAGVTKHFVGIRAVDDQGNVGRVAVIRVHDDRGSGGSGAARESGSPAPAEPVAPAPTTPIPGIAVAGEQASGGAPPPQTKRKHRAKRHHRAKRKHRRTHKHRRR